MSSSLNIANNEIGFFNDIYMLEHTGQSSIYDIFALKGDITDITGLPPDTLNTLQEIANAINDDPNFFQYVRDQLDLKRNISDSYDKNYINTLIAQYYTKTQTDSLLNTKLNSSEITKYYTITQTSDLFLDRDTWTTGVGNLITNINSKASASNLQNNYYNKITTDSILSSYYDKTSIDNTFNQYYNKNDVDTFLDNYYDKTYTDMTTGIIYSNINSKASITDLNSFYTQTTTNSLLDNYYPKGYIDTAFTKYYNITGVNSLLDNKVNNNTLNDYYDKSYINTALSNFYYKYQVDGLFNDYYTFTTSNSLYASAGSVIRLSNTVGSNINEIANIKITLPSLLKISDFNTTLNSYLLNSDFTSGSYVNTTQLSNLSSTTTSTINDINNIKTTLPSFLQTTTFNNSISSYLTISDFTTSSLINSTTFSNLNTTVNSTITDVSNVKNTQNSFLQTAIFNNTISSYLKINDFTTSSLINSTTFSNLNNTVNSVITDVSDVKNTQNSFLQTTVFNNTINSYLKISDFTGTSSINSTTFTGLNNTVNSVITDVSNVKNTQSSFLQTTNFNNTIGSYLQTSYFNNTIGSYLKTANFNSTIGSYLTTANFNSTINSYLTTTNFNSTIASYLTTVNFTNTIGSYLTTANFNSTINSYLTTSNFNSTIGSYLPTANFNTTIGSYLTTANFNSTIGSYLKTANFNTTIGSYLTTTAFNNTLTSKLTTKQDKNVYTIPNVLLAWILLGTITTTQNGNITTLEINSNNFYSGSAPDEMRCSVQFSTSNGNGYSSTGNDTTPFYGEATIIGTNNIANTNVAIEQVSATSYKFYYYTGNYPGNSIFYVKSSDTFTYSGTQATPSGCYINPTLIYTVGLDAYGTPNMYITTIRSQFFQSQGQSYSIYDSSSNNIANFNTAGSNIASTLQISGGLTSYSVLTGTCVAASGISSSGPLVSAGNTTLNNTLFVYGATTINSSLNITGPFICRGSASINSALNVSGATTMNSSLNVSGIVSSTGVAVLGNITTGTLFVSGSSGSYINSNNMLNLNGGSANGVNLYAGSNQTASFNTAGITNLYNTLVLQSLTGGDSSFRVSNTVSGTSSLYLTTNITNTSRISQDPTGKVNFNVNISSVSVLPVSLSLYTNGVCQIGGNAVNNKMLVLYEMAATDDPSTATNYYGFGVNSNTFRYQVPAVTNSHKFFCGTTQSYTITNGAGSSGSDARWKSDIQDITNALDKVKQLQGKTFVYNGCSGRQLGFIAQEVKPIVPEVVMLDDDGYHLLCYDRLVALLCESIKELERRVQILENKI